MLSRESIEKESTVSGVFICSFLQKKKPNYAFNLRENNV